MGSTFINTINTKKCILFNINTKRGINTKKISSKVLSTSKCAEKWKIIFFVFIQMRCAKKYDIVSISSIFHLHTYAKTVNITYWSTKQHIQYTATFPKTVVNAVKCFQYNTLAPSYKISTHLYSYYSNFHKFIFNCIKSKYIIAQSYIEDFLVLAKVKNVICIRTDRNYA